MKKFLIIILMLASGLSGWLAPRGYAAYRDIAGYGANNSATIPSLMCMVLGSAAISEIVLAKAIGVPKYQYMDYMMAAARDVPSVARSRIDKTIWYISELWDSKDPAATVNACMSADKPAQGSGA